jgi:MFS family permease
VLFLALRLLQGVFVGGVVASSHTIATESVAPRWRGLISGAVGAGSGGVGTLLASTSLLVANGLFPGAAFAVWGWRLVFASGLVVSLLSLLVFAWMEESPLWLDARGQRRAAAPLRTVLSGTHGRRFALNLLVVAGAGTQYYLTGGFLPTFLPVVVRLPRPAVAEVLLAVAAAHIVASLITGSLSEVIGRRRTFLLVGLVDLAVLPFAYLRLAGAGPGAMAEVTLLAALLAFMGAAGHAPIMVFLNERFPTALRATGTSLNWNVGFAIGGVMPTFVTLLSGSPHRLPATVVGFLLAAVVVYLAGALLIPETRGRFA